MEIEIEKTKRANLQDRLDDVLRAFFLLHDIMPAVESDVMYNALQAIKSIEALIQKGA